MRTDHLTKEFYQGLFEVFRHELRQNHPAGTKFTIIIRSPGEGPGTALMSDDDRDAVISFIQRSKAHPVPGQEQ